MGSGQPPRDLPTIRFPGQYFDAETGLHYNRFRYYDPGIGRYVSADPIGQTGETNLYSYAANNPTRFIDPSGLLYIPFVGDVNAGESYGDYAAQYYADKSVDPCASDVEKAAATALGLLASLWTSDTSNQTAAALVAAYAASRALEAATSGGGQPDYGSTPEGRPFTEHYGTETGPERNIPGSIVDQTINENPGFDAGGGKTGHYDPNNNVTVITGRGGGIVSARKGKPRSGQY